MKKRPAKTLSAKEQAKQDKLRQRRIEASKRERANLTKTSLLAPDLADRLPLAELRKLAPKVKSKGVAGSYGIDANARQGLGRIKPGK
jgi:hypothetical protein